MGKVTIRDIRVILTAPRGNDLICVKVETSEPGLYGLGCATFTQRYTAVVTVINDYLKPLLLGHSVEDINEIWQLVMSNSYWRNGPVLNNALSGIDEALWDIKGKMAGMPVYELLGGKHREAAAVYRHADGNSIEEVDEMISRYIEDGYHYIRVHCGFYGGNMDMSGNGKSAFPTKDIGRQEIHKPEGALPGAYYDPSQYMRSVVDLFAHVREKFGYGIELLHDVHERLTPADALRLAKDLEPYRLFFLEDALAPELMQRFGALQPWQAIAQRFCSIGIYKGEY